MTFYLGKGSRAALVGVHPRLVSVVELAIQSTPVDFAVLEGLRTKARQAALLASGATWTLDGQHIKQADGYGHAVDVGAWVGGRLAWDWPLYYRIGGALRAAAIKLDVPTVWGGVWDRRLNSLSADLEKEVALYVARRRKLKLPARIDGQHIELERAAK